MYVRPISTRLLRGMLTPEMRAIALPLPLLVAGVGADHEHPAVPPDDLALLAHRLDRGTYLHAEITLFCWKAWLWIPHRGSGDRCGRRYLGEETVPAPDPSTLRPQRGMLATSRRCPSGARASRAGEIRRSGGGAARR